ALLLIGLKTAVWLMSGSVSLLASLTDSLMDAGASLINLLAVGYALTPADKGHRFGHGKAEALAGLAQSAFITLSAGLVLWQGSQPLRHPMPLDGAWYGGPLMLLSLSATLLSLRLPGGVLRRAGSAAIRAGGLHDRARRLMNTSISVAP